MSLFVLKHGLDPIELAKSVGERFSAEKRKELTETVSYRDTFDWRLWKAGLTLATSRSKGHTRTVVTTQDGSRVETLTSRAPLFADSFPPGAVRELVQNVMGPRRLFPRAKAEWRENLLAVLNEDGKTVAHLRLREGEVLSPRSEEGAPGTTRLECLSLKGYEADGERVRAALRRRFKLKTEIRSEASVVFHLGGQTPGDYASGFRLALDPEMSAVEATRRIHLSLLEVIRANQEGVIRDWDPEFLHDIRVAIRRTRAALTQLKCVFPDPVVERIREEFRWLGSRTGPARDMDVHLLTIPRHRAALHPDSRKDLEPLVQLLREKKRIEHRRLRGCLRSKRYGRLMEDWRTFLESEEALGLAPSNAGLPILILASDRIWKAFNKVLKKGNAIGRDASPESLHRLRIDCKNLRYLITFFRSLFPPEELSPITKELKRLQQHLGDFNDLQVQRKALEDLAQEMVEEGSGPPATLLAMGQLLGQLQGAQELEREAFHEHFRRFSRPKTQRRFEALFGPGPKETQ